jgi:hypothetical protein
LIAKEQGKAYQDAVENHIFRKYLLALREGTSVHLVSLRSLSGLSLLHADTPECTRQGPTRVPRESAGERSGGDHASRASVRSGALVVTDALAQ